MVAQDRTGWPNELVYAAVPVEASKDATQRYAPLIAHLEKTLGLKIKFQNGADYTAVILAQKAKQVAKYVVPQEPAPEAPPVPGKVTLPTNIRNKSVPSDFNAVDAENFYANYIFRYAPKSILNETNNHLEDYVGSLSGYRKNDYPDLPPPLRRRIVQAWRRSFEEWGYPTD